MKAICIYLSGALCLVGMIGCGDNAKEACGIATCGLGYILDDEHFACIEDRCHIAACDAGLEVDPISCACVPIINSHCDPVRCAEGEYFAIDECACLPIPKNCGIFGCAPGYVLNWQTCSCEKDDKECGGEGRACCYYLVDPLPTGTIDAREGTHGANNGQRGLSMAYCNDGLICCPMVDYTELSDRHRCQQNCPDVIDPF